MLNSEVIEDSILHEPCAAVAYLYYSSSNAVILSLPSYNRGLIDNNENYIVCYLNFIIFIFHSQKDFTTVQ